MSLKSVEIRNYRCFTDVSPLIIPMDATVLAFVGPNNAGKTTALKAFYELRPLWQHCAPSVVIGHHGKNHGMGGSFIGVKDQAEVYPHGSDKPLMVTWRFAKRDGSPSAETDVRNIRVWIERPSHLLKTEITLGSGQKVPENADLSWHQDSEAFSWPSSGALASIAGLADAAKRFGNAKFVPAVRSAATSSQGLLYEAPQGTALAAEWNAFKTGHEKSKNDAADVVESTLARLFGFEGLQVNVGGSGGNEFSIKIGRSTYRLDEIGNGFSHLLYLAIDTILRPSFLLLIDEPESGLHPALQRELLSFLAEHSSGNLYFATHSVGLARSVADKVLAIHRHEGKLNVREMASLKSYAQWLGELSFSTWSEFGFEALLLVEGPTELRALPHILRLLKLDGKVMLQSLGGSDLINGKSASALGEYKRLNRPVFVLIDGERSNADDDICTSRQGFVDACKNLQYNIHVLERRAFDNYLCLNLVRRAVRGPARALEPFEKLTGEEPGWSKPMVPAIVQHMQWDDIRATDLGIFLDGLRNQILKT